MTVTDTSLADDPHDNELAAALASLPDRLEAERDTHRIPGLSVAVVHDQDVLWAGGFGQADLVTRAPAGPQTVYRVGSLTKLFTATMLMQLRDTGHLHLDDPLERFLPAFRIRSRFADARPVTFRQVVSHTAGLPREAPLDYRETLRFPTIEEILGSLTDTELYVPPLTEFRYSNLGIALMGHALEVVAARPYTEYVTERILQPLGMRSSAFEPDGDLGTQVATGYVVRADGNQPRPAPDPHRRGLTPCGQLYSSVEDLAHFASLQFRDRADDGPGGNAQVLGATTLREMRAPLFMQPDWRTGVGIGWLLSRVGDFTAIGHGGGTEGFGAHLLLVPELKLGIAVCANARIEAGRICRPLAEVLAPAVHRAREHARAAQTAAAVAGGSAYTGGFSKRDFADLEITLAAGRLVGTSPQLPGTTIVFAPDEYGRGNVFRMAGGPESGQFAVFEVTPTGRAAAVRVGPYRFERTQGE